MYRNLYGKKKYILNNWKYPFLVSFEKYEEIKSEKNKNNNKLKNNRK